ALLMEKLDLELREISLWLVNYFQQTGVRPMAEEASFNSSRYATLPPLRLQLSKNRAASVRGQIDRIDHFVKDGKSWFIVVDCKIRTRAFDFYRWAQNESFQLPNYLLVIEASIRK